MQAFQFVVSVLAAWVFDRTIGQDPLLTPQAWFLGVILSGAGTAYAATVLTLLGIDLVKGLDLTFAVRDLFDKQSGVGPRTSTTGQALPWGGRTYWLQLEYRFQ